MHFTSIKDFIIFVDKLRVLGLSFTDEILNKKLLTKKIMRLPNYIYKYKIELFVNMRDKIYFVFSYKDDEVIIGD